MTTKGNSPQVFATIGSCSSFIPPTSPSSKDPLRYTTPSHISFGSFRVHPKRRCPPLVGLYSSQVLAIIKAKPFFCVVDEAQVAVYMGAFSSSDGKTPRPVLRPLVGYFKMLQSIRLIVSGTGFSLSLFTDVMGSNVSKATTLPFVDHFTGNFFEEEAQLSYVARYLPHTY